MDSTDSTEIRDLNGNPRYLNLIKVKFKALQTPILHSLTKYQQSECVS